MENDKTIAKFFYEQCAGTTMGHMAYIPNNPALWTLMCATQDGSLGSDYAVSEKEFISFLQKVIDGLSEDDDESDDFELVDREVREFDVVEVVTSRYQEEPKLATVLELTTFEGEEAAVIQYHYNSCDAQTVCTKFMKPIERK